ncbi:J domain-containing protein [Sphingomonas quercus]|uniref:J domain-containing protein n=1 Tax=Sphingomonas quercus TaxID=2842451 RepID=A0ABS6BFY7_9SPHN|nr:J domain-containing protein [Sphingomonas quercus]MBU3077206.1 J domain-containing protein [Sphingomonas quercus]
MAQLILAGLLGYMLWKLWTDRERNHMSAADARRLLDLSASADARAINDAHRRLIARVHPDVGGSEELARRVNVARDTLLAELSRRS